MVSARWLIHFSLVRAVELLSSFPISGSIHSSACQFSLSGIPSKSSCIPEGASNGNSTRFPEDVTVPRPEVPGSKILYIVRVENQKRSSQQPAIQLRMKMSGHRRPGRSW
jgi:hypothetical protein